MQLSIDITEQQAAELDELAERTGKTRADVIREALEKYMERNRQPLSAFYGLWRHNPETQDVEAFRRRIWSGCGE